ncbi:hypothetical protein GGR44_001355 [Sphingobium fontiphilum]|uniref:DUF4402 domain-containing protein n=2 Tax=Sphingobium fontiphilum TaxID=944425 RepID=A0A7W6GNV1_9SPHN|nr:hypothetical protein [Sphingobium fontiphilum]
MEKGRIILHPLMTALFLAVSFPLSSSANAQARPNFQATASVVIMRTLSAQQASVLRFGRVMPSAGGGAVTIFTDGHIACSGMRLCDAQAAPAHFVVTGSDTLVAVSVPDEVVLVGPGGDSLRLTPSLSTSQIALSDGQETVTIGGTLAIGADQSLGSYAGQYEIKFEYQ